MQKQESNDHFIHIYLCKNIYPLRLLKKKQLYEERF